MYEYGDDNVDDDDCDDKDDDGDDDNDDDEDDDADHGNTIMRYDRWLNLDQKIVKLRRLSYASTTDGPTEGWTDGRRDEQTYRLIEMKGRI